MADSGVHFFVDNGLYYRQIDQMTISLCAAKQITDEHWTEYLEGAYAIAKKLRRPPIAGIMCCVDAFPSAKQRQASKEFIKEYYESRFMRVTIVTDSAVIRGAMTAMRWLIPSLTMRAFSPAEIAEGVKWLREVAEFDEPLALDAWSDALTKLSLSPGLDQKK